MKMLILFGLVLGVISGSGKVFFAEVKQGVTLQCCVTTCKLLRILEWHKEDLIWRMVRMPTKGSSLLSLRSKLKNADLQITTVEERDAGNFKCVLDGKTYEHSLIVVSVSVDPSGILQVGTQATLKCLVKSPERTADVQWRKPDGSIHNKEEIVLQSVALSDKGTWQCKVSKNGDTFVKNVTIDVKAPKLTTPALNKNLNVGDSKNEGNSSGGVSNQPGGPPFLLGLIWWVWVAIAAGSLIVLILVIVVVVMYKRNKRRKKKFLRRKMAPLSQKPKKYCECVRQTAAPKPQQGRRREKPSALPLQPLLQD